MSKRRQQLFLLILFCAALVLVFSRTRPAHAAAPAIAPAIAITVPAAVVPTPLPLPPLSDRRAAGGRQVYLQNYCGVCHTLAAARTHGGFGPPHDHMAATARQRISDPAYSGQATTVIQYLRESIADPAAYAAPGYLYTSHPMPSYAHLPRRDLDALLYFLLQQK